MNHPSTIRDTDAHSDNVDWGDHAALHLAGRSDGLLTGLEALRRGTFAELISQVMAMPEDERSKYVIEKAGDREYQADEIAALAARADFPYG